MNPVLAQLPADPGTYVLCLCLDASRRLTIGKRGDFDFPAGYYLYVGSAFGSGGLRGRLKHHLRPVTNPHWHIDYLRVAAPLRAIWYASDEAIYEHAWADTLLTLSDNPIIAPGFGASDCTCPTHLIYMDAPPDYRALQHETDAAVCCICLSG